MVRCSFPATSNELPDRPTAETLITVVEHGVLTGGDPGLGVVDLAFVDPDRVFGCVDFGAESRYYEQSLYKLGWSQFKLAWHEDSDDGN